MAGWFSLIENSLSLVGDLTFLQSLFLESFYNDLFLMCTECQNNKIFKIHHFPKDN